MTRLADQQTAADALAQLSRTFGALPGARFHLDAVQPDRIEVVLHDDLNGFERWREALGIESEAVAFVALPNSVLLEAETTYAGSPVRLSGFASPLSTSEPHREGSTP